MNNKIRNVLLKLNNNGYSAYVIGGYVRDFLLGIETYDVDITTDAPPAKVKEIFELNNGNDENYGKITFYDSLYNYDITTFREEDAYQSRHPSSVKFVSKIEDDLHRRDFTINAIYMDESGKIYDPYNGIDDLNAKVIRAIGSIDEKMSEDPLRILRAIRFASTLNFEIEENLLNYIRQNNILINTLSYTRKKEELDKIFKHENKLSGLELIKKLRLDKNLEIVIPDDISYCENYLGIWAQIEYSENYQFSNSDEDKINDIKEVVSYGIIDNITMYNHGLYACISAGEILRIPRSIISNIYKNLPIYSMKDIEVNGDDIISLLNIDPSDKIKKILHDIEINILTNELENKKEVLEKYILDNWR